MLALHTPTTNSRTRSGMAIRKSPTIHGAILRKRFSEQSRSRGSWRGCACRLQPGKYGATPRPPSICAQIRKIFPLELRDRGQDKATQALALGTKYIVCGKRRDL